MHADFPAVAKAIAGRLQIGEMRQRAFLALSHGLATDAAEHYIAGA